MRELNLKEVAGTISGGNSVNRIIDGAYEDGVAMYNTGIGGQAGAAIGGALASRFGTAALGAGAVVGSRIGNAAAGSAVAIGAFASRITVATLTNTAETTDDLLEVILETD